MLQRPMARMLLAVFLAGAGWGVGAIAQTLGQPLEDAAARVVKTPHPPGCLAAWPARQTLTGTLLGIVLPPFPVEDPPVPARSFLFLSPNSPIAVCATPGIHYPAYEDVIRIKISTLSPADFRYAMKTWGPDEIRITGTLNTAQTMGQLPGPVIFGINNFRFCWRPLTKTEYTPRWIAPNAPPPPAWTCLSSDQWFNRLPGPHLGCWTCPAKTSGSTGSPPRTFSSRGRVTRPAARSAASKRLMAAPSAFSMRPARRPQAAGGI